MSRSGGGEPGTTIIGAQPGGETSLRSRFRELSGGTEAPRVAAAPGRVNLIGEHTDYNDGWVLPMAIERGVRIAFARRPDRRIRAYSVIFEESSEIDLDHLTAPGGSRWDSYIAGVAWAMADTGISVSGADMVIDGDVPLGSGLSSSAALEMATARVLCSVSGIEWSAVAMARIAQVAENRYVGVSCGLMDQLASAAAEEGHALLLDCRSLATEAVPIPDDVVVVVLDTGVRRTLAGSAYNQRRSSCETAVRALQALAPDIRALRDVDQELLEAGRSRIDEISYRRASHVVAENRRPLAMAAALRDGDLQAAGRLMDDSHASLRDLYEVSCDELDLITRLARDHPACHGARLTGAGFGGCAVALVAADRSDAFITEVGAAYRDATDLPGELFASRPSAGATLLE
jgi:galactokinase